jgi:hypothetical protein
VTLMIDTFSDQCRAFAAEGWVFTAFTRYDPTHISGTTPTGRVFTLDCVDGTVTLTIAGFTRSVTRARSLWEDGTLTGQVIRDAYALFPANRK